MPAQRGLFTPPELFDPEAPAHEEAPEELPEAAEIGAHLLEQEWSRRHRAYVAERPCFAPHALGPVTLEEEAPTSRYGARTWAARATCACGAELEGRCCSAQSAREWLATEHHHHKRAAAGRHPFEVVAEL